MSGVKNGHQAFAAERPNGYPARFAEDPDLAPRTETPPPFLEARNVCKKLGLTPAQFAEKLGVAVATVAGWERGETSADPILQALLRILDRIPGPALRALEA